MKGEGLLEKRERDLRKKVFCTIVFPGKLPEVKTDLMLRIAGFINIFVYGIARNP